MAVTVMLKTPLEVMAWMSNYILIFYMDVLTYQCPNLDADLANLY